MERMRQACSRRALAVGVELVVYGMRHWCANIVPLRRKLIELRLKYGMEV